MATAVDESRTVRASRFLVEPRAGHVLVAVRALDYRIRC